MVKPVLIRLPGESDAGYEARQILKQKREAMGPPTKSEFLIFYSAKLPNDYVYKKGKKKGKTDPYRCENGDKWTPVMNVDVPEGLKHPDNIADLRNGIRLQAKETPGALWWKVMRVKNPAKLKAVK